MAGIRFSSVLRQAGWRALVGFFGTVILVPAVLFLAAGRLDWWPGWAVSLFTAFTLVGSRILLIRRNPQLALERAHAGEKAGVKSWDRILMPLSMLFYMPLTWIAAGLDVRFSWSPPADLYGHIGAFIAMAAGYGVAIWAFLENAFFSTYVRIQSEREHTVVSSGPYAVIRHPAYAGGLLSALATPFVLGSNWALIPTLIGMAVMVARTVLEDRALRAELPGYAGYARQVRWRLLPGVW